MRQIRYGGVVAGEAEVNAAVKVLRGQGWSLGPIGEKFEKALAKVQSRQHALYVNSGSSALFLVMVYLHDLWKEGKLPSNRVAVPATGFGTDYSTIKRAGLEPVLIDVDDSFNMNPRELKGYLNLGAVLFIHLAGNPTNIRTIKNIAHSRGWLLVEDNCEGFGGYLGKKKVGTYGDFSVTSFHPAHQISTGEGGAIFVDEIKVYRQLKRLRDWGRSYGKDPIPGYYENYTFSESGFNFRPTDIQAAIGLVQLNKLKQVSKSRFENYHYLKERIQNIHGVLPRTDAEERASWYTFPMLASDRDSLRRFLERKGIETRTILVGNYARQPSSGAQFTPGDYPMAERIFEDGLWFSVHQSLTKADLDYIIATVKEFYD